MRRLFTSSSIVRGRERYLLLSVAPPSLGDIRSRHFASAHSLSLFVRLVWCRFVLFDEQVLAAFWPLFIISSGHRESGDHWADLTRWRKQLRNI